MSTVHYIAKSRSLQTYDSLHVVMADGERFDRDDEELNARQAELPSAHISEPVYLTYRKLLRAIKKDKRR